MPSSTALSKFATCLGGALLVAFPALAFAADAPQNATVVAAARGAMHKQRAFSSLQAALATAPVSFSSAAGQEALGGALGDDAQETLKDLKATQVVPFSGFDAALYAAFKALPAAHSQESRLVQCLPGLSRPVQLWRLTKGASALNYERQAVTPAAAYQQLQAEPSLALMATSFGEAGAHMAYAESAPLASKTSPTPVLRVGTKLKQAALPGPQETCKDPEGLTSPMLDSLTVSGVLGGVKWKMSSANGSWSRSVDYPRADRALAQAVFDALVQQREAAGDALSSDSSIEMWEPKKASHVVRLRSYAYADGAQRAIGMFMDDHNVAIIDRIIPPTTK